MWIGVCHVPFTVTTSRPLGKMGCAAVTNGELLAVASGRFDVLITLDRNLSFQQNTAALPPAIIVLRGKTSRLADLLPLVP